MLDRLVAHGFGAALRAIGPEDRMTMSRPSPSRITLAFPQSGRTFELVVKCPKSAEARKKASDRWKARVGPRRAGKPKAARAPETPAQAA